MAEDRILKFLNLLEGASDESQAEIAYLALEAMRDTAAAIDVCVGWADASKLLGELRDAVLDRISAPAPDFWLPSGVEPPEEAPGAGDPELEETAGAVLTPPLEAILFEMYRHELIAEAEDADDRPGPGGRTLLAKLRSEAMAASPAASQAAGSGTIIGVLRLGDQLMAVHLEQDGLKQRLRGGPRLSPSSSGSPARGASLQGAPHPTAARNRPSGRTPRPSAPPGARRPRPSPRRRRLPRRCPAWPPRPK